MTVFGSEFDGLDPRPAHPRARRVRDRGDQAARLALTSQNRPLLETAGILVAFAVTAVTDVLLIPSHADLGASIASTISYTAGGLAMAVLFVHALGGRLSDLLPRGSEVRWFWDARPRPHRPRAGDDLGLRAAGGSARSERSVAPPEDERRRDEGRKRQTDARDADAEYARERAVDRGSRSAAARGTPRSTAP